MKYHFKALLILPLATLLFNFTSCTTEPFEIFSDTEIEQNQTVSIEWTAFKFPTFEDRVGVSGSFDSFEYSLNQNGNNILDQLRNSEITIFTSSVNVGNNNIKTSNIAKHFFPYFSSHIYCKVIAINKESAEIEISINDVTEYVIFKVELDEEKRNVKISGSIDDLMVFGAQKAFTELNEVCSALHDGFVWPDVAINVTIADYDLLLN